ncbi:MAG TPA: helix-turn-helix domain-containing protein [Candidatus Nitrosotalea sp.]|nr:helix-turn-helix domain-containing protein [Candidatus Nitrosotalea sp.]
MRPEQLVEFTESLARIAASGGGAKALAAQLARMAGGGVLLEDANWRPIATAGSGEIPPSARAVVESGAPGRSHRVSSGDQHVGWLSIFGTNSAADTDLLLRVTAAAIGVELARNGSPKRGRTQSFWEALIARAFHDTAAAREEAAAHGITLAPYYVAIALEAEVADPARGEADLGDLRALVIEAFRSSEGDLGAIERGATLLLLVPATRAVDASNAKTAAGLLPKNLARRKPHVRISGGVGTVETPPAIGTSIAAAGAALAIGRRIYGSGRVALYDELGAYRVLYEGANVEHLRAFAAEVLAPLRSYDEKHQTELERTLKLYFKTGQNVKTAAAELSVHRHTIFYRLRQIGEICARSLDTHHDQLTLRLAVAIDELHDAI